MGTIKATNIEPIADNGTVTLGSSGDTITIPSGATFNTTGSTITGITQGITEADIWYTTSGQLISADVTTTVSGNWSRSTTYGGLIGTGMTESSGDFTFPSTGIWLVSFHAYFNGFGGNGASDANYCASNIRVTTNNSSYIAANGGVGLASSNINPKVRYVENKHEILFDVTNTSTHKVRFSVYIEANNGTLTGQSSTNYTYAIFQRLGDT